MEDDFAWLAPFLVNYETTGRDPALVPGLGSSISAAVQVSTAATHCMQEAVVQ